MNIKQYENGAYRMGYTVDKKTGKIILTPDVTIKPEKEAMEKEPLQYPLSSLPSSPVPTSLTPGTFVFPVTGQKVRTVWHEGNVWFVGKDVAECLGYRNLRQAILDYYKGSREMRLPTAGGLQLIKIIPESDVYRLVMRSKLPAAEQFQTWVCEEVLPAIRKTGGYGVVVPAPSAPAKTEDQLILEAMQVLLSRTETLKAELAEAKPKADYYDALVDSRDLLTPTEAAKLFGMPARKLTAFLREKPHKWLFKGFDGANIPMQPIIDAGYMQVRHRTSSLNGMPCTQGYFTPKGIEVLRGLLKAWAEAL